MWGRLMVLLLRAWPICLPTGRHTGSPTRRIVSNARVSPMRQVSWDAGGVLPRTQISRSNDGLESLTQHLGMLGCGLYRYHDRPSSLFSGARLCIYSTRRYL